MKKPASWKTVKISEAFQLRPPKKEARDALGENDLVSFLPMEDLDVFARDVYANKEKPLREVSSSYTYFSNNDVLLAKITPCFENGKLGIARNLKNGIGFGSSEYIVFRSKDEVTPEFLFYYLARDEFRTKGEKSMTGAAGQKRVPPSFVESLEISYPPLPEQQRIVALLDETFAGLAQVHANAERNRINAREVFGSYLESLFADSRSGWEEKKLGEVCERITDGTHVTPKYVPEGIPFLSVKNLTKGFIDFSDTRFITPEEHAILTKRVRPERDDVLYTKVGTTGIAKVVDVDVEFSIFVSIALLKLKHDMIFNKYLELFLNSPFARKQAQQRTRGTANKNLVITDIKEIEIHFPKSLEEQHAIVERLDALAAETLRLEGVYQQKIDAVEELRKSLLRKAFEGEL